MGIYYVKLDKIDETASSVTYQFYSGFKDCEGVGIFEVDKETGGRKILKDIPGDINNALGDYAYRAILKHWQKGEFPDKACWAS